jgi:hypothetical protein
MGISRIVEERQRSMLLHEYLSRAASLRFSSMGMNEMVRLLLLFVLCGVFSSKL